MQSITDGDLGDDAAGILRRVEAGKTIVVTPGGRPIAEVRSRNVGRQRLVPRSRLLALSQRSPPIERHRFRDDLDAVADPWFDG